MRIELNFLNLALATATFIFYSVIFAAERTLCCWVQQERNSWSLSCLVFFSGGVIHSLEELQVGFPGLISDQWHDAILPSSPTAQSMEETALFWWRQWERVSWAHQECVSETKWSALCIRDIIKGGKSHFRSAMASLIFYFSCSDNSIVTFCIFRHL